jgi:hypothetical protein
MNTSSLVIWGRGFGIEIKLLTLYKRGHVVMKLNKFILTILISIFILSSQVYGAIAPEYNVRNLFVSIKNLGTENCQLIEHTITHGVLVNSNVPRILDTSGEKFVFIVNGYNPEIA